MNVLVAVIFLVAVYEIDAESEADPIKIKCVEGTVGEATAENECDDDVTKCSFPKFTEFTGFVDSKVAYKCGPCVEGTKDTSCEECNGAADKACQAVIETNVFKCKDWEYNKTEKKFQLKDDSTTCKKLKDSAIKCNMPGPDATEDYVYTVENKGCGGCKDADKTAKKCEECTEEECNNKETPAPSSASSVTALIAPLFAALYALL